MNTLDVKKAYKRYSPVYDLLFGAVYQPGREQALAYINSRPGRRILEVGVGTGLSLPGYRADCRVVGIDLSEDMLRVARERVEKERLTNVEALLQMDAENLEFPDHSFDVVVAMYVASVVPDLPRVLSEMKRVCAEGGDIIICNHFASSNPLVRRFEKAVARFSNVIGWKTDLSVQTLQDLVGLPVIESMRLNAFGYWRLLRFRNVPQTQAAEHGAAAE